MSAIFKDSIEITDKQGFRHEVSIEHHPDVGTSIAYYNGRIISNFNYGICRPPRTDDDAEWEEYESRFFEGIGGEALQMLEYRCSEIINNEI